MSKTSANSRESAGDKRVFLAEGYDEAFVPEVMFAQQGTNVMFFRGAPTSLVEAKLDDDVTIIESFDDFELEEKDGQKVIKNGKWIVEGPFQRSDTKNANGRVYARKIWDRIVGNPKSPQQQRIKERAMIGHNEHPKDGRTDLNEGSLLTSSLTLRDDGVVWGIAELLDTPKGRLLQEYTHKGIRWGVSSRGSGTVGADGRVSESDYELDTFDAVSKPSTPGAYPSPPKVNAKMEDKPEDTEDKLAEAGYAVIRDVDGIAAELRMGKQTASEPYAPAGGKAKAIAKLKKLAKMWKATSVEVIEDLDGVETLSETTQTFVEGVESLLETLVNSGNSRSCQQLISDLLDQWAGLNAKQSDGDIPQQNAVDLQTLLHSKLTEVLEAAQEAALQDAIETTIAGEDGEDEDERVESQVALERAHVREERLTTEVLALRDKLTRTVARLRALEADAVGVDAVTDNSVEALETAEAQLQLVQNKLDAAEAYIQTMSEEGADAGDLEETVTSLIEQEPALTEFKSVLLEATTSEHASRLADVLTSRVAVEAHGDGSSVRRTTLPGGGLILESEPGIKAPRTQSKSHRGAKTAASALGRMKIGKADTT